MGALVVSPAMNPSPGYDALQDFTHIALFGGTPHVLVVHPQLGVKSFADLVAVARKESNGLGYLSASQGSPGNLVGELLSDRQHLNLVHVSYRGAGQAINDLIGGHVKVGVITFSTASNTSSTALCWPSRCRPQSGYRKCRKSHLHELGMPELVTTSWYGLSGPAKMPSGIVTRLMHPTMRFRRPRFQRIIREEAVQVPDEPSRGDSVRITPACKANVNPGPLACVCLLDGPCRQNSSTFSPLLIGDRSLRSGDYVWRCCV